MFSYKLISHENILLKDHLNNVSKRCVDIVTNKCSNLTINKELLIKVAEVMGYTHDLGKGTEYFQTYLNEMISYGESDVNKELRSHAFISALITYYELKDIDEELALIAYTVVKRHHGNLENIDVEYKFNSINIKSYKKLVTQQYDKLYIQEVNNILEQFLLKPIDKNKLIQCIEEIRDYTDDYLDEIYDYTIDLEKYIIYKYLFSILIYADKEDAIFHKTKDIDYDIPFNIVDLYKTKVFKKASTSLNIIRNNIYKDVIKSIDKTESRIMSITVPTGTGKTLTAFSAALYLRKRLQSNSKIVYCLPFTSIIDQNYSVYSNIIKTILGENKLTNDRIIKHHYLTERKYIDEEESYSNNESKFLIENWNSQLIVTTFMQFFNSIFSNLNRENVKYNNIANSIVLLDEIQSIPYKYWSIINKLFKNMADKLNIYFILITATQQLIFNKEKGEITELVPNNEQYFKLFKRTKIHVDLEKKQYEDFLYEVEELIYNNENSNILIIVNTIRMAQKLYNEIKDLELNNTDMFFLSTGIIPKERTSRISKIKDKSSKRKIIVSTQLIEAGVDIDMDIIVRELAPLDSINQSAGRANREYRGEYFGDVYVFNMTTDNSREYSSFVYDQLLIDKTKKVLTKFMDEEHIIYEENYINLNNEYFKLVNRDKSNKDSKKLIEEVKQLKFKDIKQDFKLIDADDKVSVFIEVDSNANEVYNKWLELREVEDKTKRYEMFDAIKKEFYSYVITVYKNKVRESQTDEIVYISYDELDNSYDLETGYMLEDNDIIF